MTATEAPPLLEVRDLHKRFGGVHALRGASLTIRPGETMALVGDNGAGKSTLVKAIAGIQPADTGSILLNGEAVDIRSPKDAGRLGIEVVYQDLALADSLDVPSNVFLGEEPVRLKLGWFSVPDTRRIESETRSTLARMRINIPDYRVPVAQLSGGQRQAVAVGRSIRKSGTILLVLDEPTAALGVEEVRKVLDLINSLKADGQAMLVISHDLEHVFQVSDRISVIRSGQIVATRTTADSTKSEIVHLIVGDIEGRAA